MTKTKAKRPDYGEVTPALLEQIKSVIAEGDKHRYSVSAVYGAYNAAFNKKDTPQTCSSCLRNRVRELRTWLAGYEKNNTGKDVVIPQYNDPTAPGYVGQAQGSVRYPMAEGLPFDFLPYEGTIVKGTITLANGSKIKPGTYITAEGLEITVQPGGKASIKEIPEEGEITNTDKVSNSSDNPSDLL